MALPATSLLVVVLWVSGCVMALPAPQSEATASIEATDPTLMADLFEGDIMLTETTWNSRRDQKYRWKDGKIPYHISHDFDGMVRGRETQG